MLIDRVYINEISFRRHSSHSQNQESAQNHYFPGMILRNAISILRTSYESAQSAMHRDLCIVISAHVAFVTAHALGQGRNALRRRPGITSSLQMPGTGMAKIYSGS